MTRFQKGINLGIIAAVIFATAILLEQSSIFNSFNRSILDTQFRVFQREDPNDEVALISIDERSLNRFAEQKVYWPWPREFYQVVTDYLHRMGARAVVFDILFDTPDFDRINVVGTASDNRFAESLDSAGMGVLALKTSPADESSLDIARVDSTLFDIEIAGEWPPATIHNYLSIPIPKFLESAETLGNTHVKGDEDGVIRRVQFFEKLAGGESVPSLAMATYLMLQPDTTGLEWTHTGLRVGDSRIPLQNGNYLINWYKKGGVKDGTFPYYSFFDVLRSAVTTMRQSGTPPLPDSTFKDKVVFIGASAAGLADIKSTPLSSLEDFPGMEIFATVYNNLVDKNFIRQPSKVLSYAILFLLIAIMIGLTSYYRPLKGSAYSVGVLLLVVVLEVALFVSQRYWMPIGFYISTGFVAFTASLGYKYFTEEREKIKLKSAFNQYVQPELVEEIVNKRESLTLGGEKKNMTVMFSDLKGFTSMSEEETPESLVNLLNDYLDEMINVIFEHDGTVDKFIGDAVMAFWGAPLPQEEHAILCCRATLQMNRKLEELNERWAGTGRPELAARYGINTGEMIVGNMGSQNRFNYTVIGDSVNLAARLEPLNNLFGTDILISEDTFAALKDEFVCRQVGQFIVKGKSKPVTVFELLADRTTDNTAGMEERLRVHREAIRLYYDRKWEAAKEKFEQLLEEKPDDGLVKTYIDYCKQHIKYPPDDDWTGTFRMSHK